MLLWFLMGCSLSKVGVQTFERRAERQGLRSRTYRSASHELRYWIGGDGPPILLIHGFGGNGLSTWSEQIAPLMEERTVIVTDLLWFGESDSQASPSLAAQAQAHLELLDYVGVGQVDVMSISYGGFVTLKMHADDPDRFRNLIIVASPGPAYDDNDLEDMLDRFGVSSPGDIFLPDTPQDVQRLFDLVYYEDRKLPNFILKDIQKNLFTAHRGEQQALLDELPSNRIEMPLDAIPPAPPSLIIWGRHDPVFPVKDGRELAQALGAQFYIIERAEHGPNVEHPEEFNRVVTDFLRRTPVTPP